MMLHCDHCNQDVQRKFIPENGGIYGCRSCVDAFMGRKYRPQANVNLGQTVQSWTHIDKKSGNEVKHRLTVGKNWEISQRTISKDDGMTVVNRTTGKPTEY